MEREIKDYISTAKAAELAGVDYRTVRYWCVTGHFECFKISDKWVIHKKSFDKFLRARPR